MWIKTKYNNIIQKIKTMKNSCLSIILIIVAQIQIVQASTLFAVNDQATSFGGSINIDLLSNDYNSDALTFNLCGGNNNDGIIGTPNHGSYSVANGVLTYTPQFGFTGLDSLEYRICDIDGNISTAWVRIIVEDCKIPNTFSPDGNGKNDTYFIPCLEGKVGARLSVYNRWGAEVYRNENYDNAWDGTYRGKNLPDGTYYYILKYNNEIYQYSVEKAGYLIINRIK